MEVKTDINGISISLNGQYSIEALILVKNRMSFFKVDFIVLLPCYY